MRKNNLLVTAFILLIIIFAGCKKHAPPVPTPIPTPTPVPHLEKIVYTYNGHLFWMNTDGTGKEELFSDSNSKWFPSVSPDGWYVAYWVENGKTYNLWIGDFREKRNYQITFDEDTLEGDIHNFNINNAVAWTKDSENLIYSRNKDIWMVTRDGYNQIAKTDTHDCISPTLSKDNVLVYSKSDRHDTNNLYIKSLESLQDQRLTKFIGQKAGSPEFSPDGRSVVFTVVDGDSVNIYSIDVQVKKENPLTHDGTSFSPSFSVDGKKIVFSSYITDKYQPEIWTMNPDGSDRTRITQDGGISPSWMYRILKEALPTFTPTPAVKGKKPDEVFDGGGEEFTEETPPPVEKTPAPAEPNATPEPEEELKVKVERRGDSLLFYPVIHFDSASAVIKSEFYPLLDDMVKIAVKYKSPVKVDGHTDNEPIETAQFPSNKELSDARAMSVKRYFISKGITASRIITTGYGEDKPRVPNTNSENMYKNRRAEIRIDLIESERTMTEKAQEKAKAAEGITTPAKEDAVMEPTTEPTVAPTPKLNFFQKLFKRRPKSSTPKTGAKKDTTGGW